MVRVCVPSMLLLVLLLGVLLPLSAVPCAASDQGAAGEGRAASCINCYGNYCGDRSRCCGSTGALQSSLSSDVAPCDDLDALCRAHDLCVADYTDATGSSANACVCDQILRNGLDKAASNATFNFDPSRCAISSAVGGGCKDSCDATSVFSVETAADWVGASASTPCACVMGARNGTVVMNISSCPDDQSFINAVSCANAEAQFKANKEDQWCWRSSPGVYYCGKIEPPRRCYNPGGICASHARRRLLESPDIPSPELEACWSAGVDASEDDLSACSASQVDTALALIPDACGCVQRDLRCLMQQGIYVGACRSHVENLLRCSNASAGSASAQAQLVAVRAMVSSSDFSSVSFDAPAQETVVERIHLNVWLPIVVCLTVLLVGVSVYSVVRARQYKRRIEQLNVSRPAGRSTGFSVVQGAPETFPYANPRASIEVETIGK